MGLWLYEVIGREWDEMRAWAEGLKAGLSMFGRMVTDFRFSTVNADLLKTLGTDPKDFLIVGVTVAILFAVSLAKERGVEVRQWISRKPLVLRWAIWYGLIFYILVFGAYGVGYIPVDPMYANF